MREGGRRMKSWSDKNLTAPGWAGHDDARVDLSLNPKIVGIVRGWGRVTNWIIK